MLEKWAASKTPQFIYQVRPEQAREILIFPRPPLHWTNKEMVSFEPFWRACKLFFDHLSTVTHSTNPVETFAFNFARWETRLSIDPSADDCHGHCHAIVKRPVVDALPEDAAAAQMELGPLCRRNGEPTDYRANNADALELHRILPQRSQQQGLAMKKLQTKVDNLETKVDNLETKVDSMLASLNKILELLTSKPAQ